jgi:DNA-binding transcriptional LysR family regulator
MELRQLRYLIAAVERGSISEASIRLNIAQPAVSRQIQSLETEVGVPLLERLSRGVSATTAGASLVSDSRRILLDLEAAVEKARLSSKEDTAHLRVGFNETYSLAEVVTRSFAQFRKAYPNISLHVASMNTRAQIESLRHGDLDVGFFYERNPRDVDLEGRVVLLDTISLMVSPNSSLAQRQSISLGELANQDFVLFPRFKDPWLYDRLMAACREVGFSPRLKQEAMNDSSMMALVAANLGVAFGPRRAEDKVKKQVAFIALEDLNISLPLELVWRASNVSPPVKAFCAVAQSIAETLSNEQKELAGTYKPPAQSRSTAA